MKIICAGFWKTGTKSLAEALRILGYNVYDYDDQLFAFSDLWSAFIDGTVTDKQIRDTLKDVDVIIDGPAIGYWEEILRAIPDAKVILTMRDDEDAWFKSYRRMASDFPWDIRFSALMMSFTRPGYRFLANGTYVFRLCAGIESPFQIPVLASNPSNARLYKMQYRKHNCHVVQSVPNSQLYIHKLGTGWGELGKFLGVDIPDISYPHKNKLGAHFHGEGGGRHPEMDRLKKRGMIYLIVIIGIFIAVVTKLL